MAIKVGWRTVKFSIYECAVLLVVSPFLFESRRESGAAMRKSALVDSLEPRKWSVGYETLDTDYGLYSISNGLPYSERAPCLNTGNAFPIYKCNKYPKQYL